MDSVELNWFRCSNRMNSTVCSDMPITVIVSLMIIHLFDVFRFLKTTSYTDDLIQLTLKEAGGGRNPPPRYFLPSLSYLLFFLAETSWLFFFKPCAWFKTIFKKIAHTVMKRRCVIARWVQRKTDQKLIFNGNYTQIVFFCFQDTLSVCFILFIWFIWSRNMCKHTLTHIIAKKFNFCLKK